MFKAVFHARTAHLGVMGNGGVDASVDLAMPLANAAYGPACWSNGAGMLAQDSFPHILPTAKIPRPFEIRINANAEHSYPPVQRRYANCACEVHPRLMKAVADQMWLPSVAFTCSGYQKVKV